MDASRKERFVSSVPPTPTGMSVPTATLTAFESHAVLTLDWARRTHDGDLMESMVPLIVKPEPEPEPNETDIMIAQYLLFVGIFFLVIALVALFEVISRSLQSIILLILYTLLVLGTVLEELCHRLNLGVNVIYYVKDVYLDILEFSALVTLTCLVCASSAPDLPLSQL
jgi:succinate-acetate transporter protein